MCECKLPRLDHCILVACEERVERCKYAETSRLGKARLDIVRLDLTISLVFGLCSYTVRETIST